MLHDILLGYYNVLQISIFHTPYYVMSCNKALQCNTCVKVNSIAIDYKVELNSLYDYTEGVLVMYTSNSATM